MIDLVRVEYTARCVRGLWLVNGHLQCATLENPWLDNQKNISCIPEGTYDFTRTVSNRFGETFEIGGVKGRTRILIHWGNTAADTEGCVLLGTEIGSLGGEPAVLQSRKAFTRFMTLMNSLKIEKDVIGVRGIKL